MEAALPLAIGEPIMDKKLQLLESFEAQGSDGTTYKVLGFEHLARDLSTTASEPERWEPIGLAEYRLADGRLLHEAAGSPRDSRLELAAALLGRMGRDDAAPYLAAMAREAGSTSLRWHALRECLGLDTATGFEALCELAATQGDPLAAAAGALRAQLLEAHPNLAELANAPDN